MSGIKANDLRDMKHRDIAVIRAMARAHRRPPSPEFRSLREIQAGLRARGETVMLLPPCGEIFVEDDVVPIGYVEITVLPCEHDGPGGVITSGQGVFEKT